MENIQWLLPIIDYVIIYNKGLDNLDYIPKNKIIKCENIGREGGTYLKHIIDNYNNLDDYTIFIQGKIYDHIDINSIEYSHNQLFSIINNNNKVPFKYISTHMISVNKEEFLNYCSGLPSLPIKDISPIATLEIINNIELPENIKNILLNKEFIEKYELTKILEDNNIDEPLRTQLFSLFNHDIFLEDIEY